MTATANLQSAHGADDFFCKDIPEPFQILGLKLRSLSIGRYRRMARHGVAFVSEEKTKAGIGDLLLGCIICSMPCKEFDEFVVSPNFTKDISRWQKRISPLSPIGRIPILGALWLVAMWKSAFEKNWRANNSFNFIEKMALFQNYIDDAQKIPKVIPKNVPHGTSTSHWSHNIEVVLRGELGWTREEIEERPLSNAIADYFKHMENQGLVAILTERDQEDIKFNDEAIKKAIAEQRAKKGVK